MKKIFFVVSFLLMSSLALAAIPKYVTVQGRLTDVNDVPVPSGSYLFNFTIWNDPTAGTLIWTDQFNAPVSNGVFNIELGRNAQLNIPFDQPYFLEVRVGGNLLTPRVNFTSAAYAFTSASGGSGSAPFLGNAGDTASAPSFTWSGDTNNGMFEPTADNIGFTTAGTERMRINATGFVGIGTATPHQKLEVNGNINVSTNNMYAGRYYDTSGTTYCDPSSTSIFSQLNVTTICLSGSCTSSWPSGGGTPGGSNGQVQYNNGGAFGGAANLCYDDSTNRVGVGTCTPSARLEISGVSGTGLSFNASGDLYVNGTTSRVGLGVANPSYQLQLSTDSAAKPSTTTWTVSSDARLKTNISNFTDGLDVIMKMRPVTYSYNGLGGFVDDGKMKVGIIAQELQPVAPYMIGTYEAKLHPGDKNDTELLNYNGNALSFVTVNAIKEQQNQIDQLKAENQQLKQKIEEIEKKLDSME